MQAKFVGRWVSSGNSMTTGYPGSSFSFKVSGTHSVTIETSGASRVAYKIDDGSYVVSASATVTITGLTFSTHTIKVVLTYTSLNNTWAGTNYATVSSITVDQGGEIVTDNPAKRRIAIFGDSITEGYMYVNSEGASKSASELTYWNKLGDMLGTDMIPCGIGGIGYVNSNTYTSFPPLSTNPSYIENINSSLVNTDTNFDVTLILLGVNDGKSKTEVDNDYVTAVTGCITRIKAKYPSADIHALIPFNNNGKPSLEQVYNAQGVHIVPQTWYSQITFGDTFHPNDNGHTVIANNLKSYFENYYGSAYFKEAIMKRIDSVYISANGTIEKITGTMAATPTAPSIPAGGIKVCEVEVEQGESNGSLYDKRQMEAIYPRLMVVNVKDYGAIGDGVADDTSAIQSAINANPTAKIYIPQGKYRVTNTIIASGSIQGAGMSRNNATYSIGTWIIADFSDSTKDVIDISSSQNSFEMSDVTIEVNNARYGINGQFTGNNLKAIRNVSVFEVTAGAGIYLTSNMTRACMLDNIVVFSSLSTTYANTGIYLGVYDVRLTNFEVMGCQTGIYAGVMSYISDGHVWCGDISYSDTSKTWWDSTIGIKIKDAANTYVFVNNVYTDTCHTSFYGKSGANIFVSNLFNLQETTALDTLTDSSDACVFACSNVIANNVEFVLSNKKYKLLDSANSYYTNGTQIKNVAMRLDNTLTLAAYLQKPYSNLLGTISKDVEYILYDNNSDATLRKIATCYAGSGGVEVTVNCQHLGIYKFVIACNNGNITSKKLIYAISGYVCSLYVDTPSNGVFNIYIKPPITSKLFAQVSAIKTSGENLINLIDMNINNKNGLFEKESWVQTGITTVDSSFSEITA